MLNGKGVIASKLTENLQLCSSPLQSILESFSLLFWFYSSHNFTLRAHSHCSHQSCSQMQQAACLTDRTVNLLLSIWWSGWIQRSRPRQVGGCSQWESFKNQLYSTYTATKSRQMTLATSWMTSAISNLTSAATESDISLSSFWIKKQCMRPISYYW